MARSLPFGRNAMATIFHEIEQTNTNEFFYGVYKDSALCPHHHFHKNYEIIIITEGKGSCILGEKRYDMNKGNFVFVSPFQPHSFTVEEGGTVLCLNFHEHMILTVSQIIERKRLTNAVFTVSDREFDLFIKDIRAAFGDGIFRTRRLHPQALRIKMKGILYYMLAKTVEEGDWVSLPTADTVIIDVIQYISDNFMNDISLKDIARDRGYNYQYLSRTFNQTLGINFKKLLNQYRMEYAFARIQDTNLPLSQIAFESGFQSIRSFDHVCRAVYHRSPQELRREQRSKVN